MERPDWVKNLKTYSKSSPSKAVFQMVNTVIPYGGVCYLMYWIIDSAYSYWYLIPLAFIGAGLYVRLFIIFHDCAHLSYLSSTKACRVIGYVFGVLTFTPFEEWRRSHMIHHGTVGNIDRRGTGDVWTMTVDEYENSTALKKIKYHVFRNPVVLFFIAPTILFLVLNRFPNKSMKRKEVFSVLLTDMGILAIILAVAFTLGIKYYLLIQVPIVFIATSVGLWLFFVQHQFKDVYWSRKDQWSIYEAAMKGSSYYKLPAVLRWFSGNIGFHHIHHLNPSIPNYNLKRCQNEVPQLDSIPKMTFFKSLKSLRLKLYDENSKKMISFSDLKRMKI